MITLTRSQVRRLRSAFRRSALGITHRGIIPQSLPILGLDEGGSAAAPPRRRS